MHRLILFALLLVLLFGGFAPSTDEQAQRKLSGAEVQAIFDRSPFIGWLGLEVVSLDHERQEITVRMAMRPELERRPGTRQFHGGPIAAFIDITGDFAIGIQYRERQHGTCRLQSEPAIDLLAHILRPRHESVPELPQLSVLDRRRQPFDMIVRQGLEPCMLSA